MSTLPLFVASQSQVKRLLGVLQVKRKEEWQTVYFDPANDVEWILHPLWDYHGPGPEGLRRGNPSLAEILNCIAGSDQDSEVSAAAYYLVNELDDEEESYGALVDMLERLVAPGGNKREFRNAALAIAWSHVDRPFNHRSPMGKSMQQINEDYEHFVALAARAEAIKMKAEDSLGYVITQQSTSFE